MRIKLGKGFAEWTGEGWADGQERVLLTSKEFRRYSIMMFVLGALSFSVFFFALGRWSVILGWV